MNERSRKGKSGARIKLFGFGIVLTMLLFANSVCVYAGSVEIVYMTPHYRHPVTGVIEDSGQNEGIGQGMTESVLFPQALLETDDGGRIYLTTRNKLAQHISSMKFAVQKRGAKGYTPVQYQVTGAGKDYKDTRFQIPSRNSIIRMEFYVEPMGRTVVFYGSMGRIVPGNTDFKVFVNVNKSQNSNVQPATGGMVSDVPQNVQETDKDTNSVNPQIASQTKGEAGKNIGFDHGLLTRNSPEVKKLLGKESKGKNKKIAEAPYGQVTKFMLLVSAIIVGILISALILTAAALPIYYRILKSGNDRREENLYAREDRFKKK